MNDGSVLLGIECGGTRTTALLAYHSGQLLEKVEAGRANLRLVDDAQLADLFQKVRQRASNPDAIGIGMAGCRSEADRDRVRGMMERVWPGIPCRVTHDLEIAWRAAGPIASSPNRIKTARVVLISGTGSCCYGRLEDGKEEKVGGWGHWLGDRGSGFDIALRTLRNAVADWDRFGRWGSFGAAALRHLMLNSPEDLIDWIQSAPKPEVAALARCAFEASATDSAPRRAIVAAAESLGEDAIRCSRRLKARAARQFVLAGGVFEHQSSYVHQLKRLLSAEFPGCDVCQLDRSAAWGAIALASEALREAGRSSHAAVTLDPSAQPSPSSIVPGSLAISPTERRNPRSARLDTMSLEKAVALMLEEEAEVPPAILKYKKELAALVKRVAMSLRHGGRLFYVGAGTSGRLGVLDASECPPTFRTSAGMVQGIIAGGDVALHRAVEGAEDDAEAGGQAVRGRNVGQLDVVVGIAASGRTPFVWGALAEARERSAYTALLCFNPYIDIALGQRPDAVLAIDLGPEVLTGSTRLKAGTATKLVLNCLTTLTMARLGKVLSNFMVDLNPSNAKLKDRAARIVVELTKADYSAATKALQESNWQVRDAVRELQTRLQRGRKRKRREQVGTEGV